MTVQLKDLKLDKIRKEIKLEDNYIKVFNAIGDKREELLSELFRSSEECREEDFAEHWYKYLIKNFTNVKIDKVKINTLFKSPKVEFLLLKRTLDEMVNEVYLDMVLAQIDNLEQQKISAHIEEIDKRAKELNEIAQEVQGGYHES